jgi:catechol 2,3-dioxygenase-like lactoylglutathione lyase family enzyme
MSILGIEKVIYGVDDFAQCTKFWSDFGLQKRAATKTEVQFETTEGASVILRAIDDPNLPAPVSDGPTMREVIWGVDTAAALRTYADRISADQDIVRDEDGTIHFKDPEGYAMGLQVSSLNPVKTVTSSTTKYNGAGLVGRINERALFYDKAVPQHLAHVVFKAPNLEKTRDFYVEKLDMRVTDIYRDRGYFLRCDGALDHHHLFLFKPDDKLGFHHVAFEVRDFHEVFGGGLHMTSQGWKTHLGPGRHGVTSAYFWYLKNPCGGAAEYDFDTDVCDDDWTPNVFEQTAQSFAEWTMPEGIEPYGGVQKSRA